MFNIPEGYDENGTRGGLGEWYEDADELDEFEETCPECSSVNVHRNEYDFLVCEDCGYEEVPEEDMGECDRCGTPTPENLLTSGLCPVCADDMGVT